MSIKLMMGFDAFDDGGELSQFSEQSGAKIESGRNGGRALYIEDDFLAIIRFDQTTNTFVVGLAINKELGNYGSDINDALFYLIGGGSTAIKVFFYNDRRIIVKSGDNTVLAITGDVIDFNVWNYYEFKVCLDDTIGSVEIRKDGNTTPAVLVENIDTLSGNAYVDKIQFGPGYPVAGNPAYFDDLYILDNSGTNNNDFKGDVSIIPLNTVSDASNTGFTPSEGSDLYAMVDDNPLINTSTDIRAITPESKAMFEMSEFSGSNNIHAVSVVVPAYKSEGGTISIKSVIESGTVPTETEGAEKFLSSSLQCARDFYGVDPIDDVPWSTARVNAIKAGVKVHS